MDSLYNTDWKWAALRGILHSVGRTSDGIALGLERGFDSGESMEYIYRNQPSGRWGIGWLADWLYLQQIGCRGLRGRKRQLQDALRETIAANRVAGQATHILDVAAGPADYLLEVFADDGGDDLSAECRDLDTAGLARGRQRGAALASRRIWVYNSGLDPAAFAALSPGVVLTAAAIERAIAAGRAEFDFLRGNEEYKYRFGAADTHIYRLRLERST